MDEFAVYRGVLSQAEILDHYNNGAGKHYAGTGSPSALAVRGAPGGGLTTLVARVIAWFGGLLGGAKLAARTPVERGQPAMQTITPPAVIEHPIMYQPHSPKMYQAYSATMRQRASPTMYQ